MFGLLAWISLGSLIGMEKSGRKRRSIGRSSKSLERLVCAGLRPTEDTEGYAAKLRQLAHRLATPAFLDKQSRLLKALANDTRLKMLRLLSLKEMCVCELTVALELTQPTASHHLNILQNVGLIRHRKEGKWVFYSLAKPRATQHLFDFLGFPS